MKSKVIFIYSEEDVSFSGFLSYLKKILFQESDRGLTGLEPAVKELKVLCFTIKL